MMIRVVLALAFAGTSLFGIYELRRSAALPEPARLPVRQRAIRKCALLFLLATLALCYYGTFLPVHQSHKTALTAADKAAELRYIIYWSFTALCALPLVPLALLDMRETLNNVRIERIAARGENIGEAKGL